jgi:hypothetical protein
LPSGERNGTAHRKKRLIANNYALLTLFRLSTLLGIPVHELREMSADELHDYAAYLSLEPVGSQADDIRTALIAHTTASCHSTKALKLQEFLPQWEPPQKVSYADGAKAFLAFLST